MQKRAIIMLLVALVMAGIAVSLVNTAIKDKDGDMTGVSPLAVMQVVVAAVDLDIGDRLNDSKLKMAEWPKASTPEGAYTTADSLLGEEPPVVIKEMKKGEVVLPYKLSGHGARAGLTPKIPSEMRAMTISVNEVRGVAGFVLPGDRVDILYTSPVEGNRNSNKHITRTIIQNLLVLGVDQSASEKEDKPQVVNAVTLLVTSKQGNVLALAQKTGELTLLLRNEGDVVVSTDDSATMADLNKRTQKATSSRKSGSGNYTSVNVIRGLSSTTYSTKLAAPAKAPTSVNPGTTDQERGVR